MWGDMIIIRVGEEPEVVEFDGRLEALQEIVGGYIECAVHFDDGATVICNEEGKLMGLPINCVLWRNGFPVDTLNGNLIIVGVTEEDFDSLSSEMVNKYLEKFSGFDVFLD